eukprot:PhM_4_TR7361/c0_g1_i1/m.31549
MTRHEHGVYKTRAVHPDEEVSGAGNVQLLVQLVDGVVDNVDEDLCARRRTLRDHLCKVLNVGDTSTDGVARLVITTVDDCHHKGHVGTAATAPPRHRPQRTDAIQDEVTVEREDRGRGRLGAAAAVPQALMVVVVQHRQPRGDVEKRLAVAHTFVLVLLPKIWEPLHLLRRRRKQKLPHGCVEAHCHAIHEHDANMVGPDARAVDEHRNDCVEEIVGHGKGAVVPRARDKQRGVVDVHVTCVVVCGATFGAVAKIHPVGETVHELPVRLGAGGSAAALECEGTLLESKPREVPVQHVVVGDDGVVGNAGRGVDVMAVDADVVAHHLACSRASLRGALAHAVRVRFRPQFIDKALSVDVIAELRRLCAIFTLCIVQS